MFCFLFAALQLLITLIITKIFAGLRKVTDDMKTKNRTDRAGVVTASEKESRTGSFSSSKTGTPKLELQMGRK